MDTDTFIAWAMDQPEGARYELFAGEIVPKAAERIAHGRAKGQVFRTLSDAVEAAGLECEVFVDGVSVPIDADTTYVPDVLIRCGPPLAGSETRVNDPIVIVEVASPSSRARDVGYVSLRAPRRYGLNVSGECNEFRSLNRGLYFPRFTRADSAIHIVVFINGLPVEVGH